MSDKVGTIKKAKTATKTGVVLQNKNFGFHGTMTQHGHDPEKKLPRYVSAIKRAGKERGLELSHKVIGHYLDSPAGRSLADIHNEGGVTNDQLHRYLTKHIPKWIGEYNPKQFGAPSEIKEGYQFTPGDEVNVAISKGSGKFEDKGKGVVQKVHPGVNKMYTVKHPDGREEKYGWQHLSPSKIDEAIFQEAYKGNVANTLSAIADADKTALKPGDAVKTKDGKMKGHVKRIHPNGSHVYFYAQKNGERKLFKTHHSNLMIEALDPVIGGAIVSGISGLGVGAGILAGKIAAKREKAKREKARREKPDPFFHKEDYHLTMKDTRSGDIMRTRKFKTREEMLSKHYELMKKEYEPGKRIWKDFKVHKRPKSIDEGSKPLEHMPHGEDVHDIELKHLSKTMSNIYHNKLKKDPLHSSPASHWKTVADHHNNVPNKMALDGKHRPISHEDAKYSYHRIRPTLAAAPLARAKFDKYYGYDTKKESNESVVVEATGEAFSVNPLRAQKAKGKLRAAMRGKIAAKDAKNLIKGIVEDDRLNEIIDMAIKHSPESDVRPAIRVRMKQLGVPLFAG